MSELLDIKEGAEHLFMGNKAIARGALEAGVHVVASYPGTPSSEIMEELTAVADERGMYVEWSTNEMLALEVAAAGSYAGLRSLCPMKQNGVYVASDFLLHLPYTNMRGGLVVVMCDDPGALSSTNEGDSRLIASAFELPLIEPGDIQEAKDMTKWAFEMSEKFGVVFMMRSVTRISHASSNVILGPLPADIKKQAHFRFDGPSDDPLPACSIPTIPHHARHQARMDKLRETFEECPFNTYDGPDKPEILIIASSACNLYSKEAIGLLDARERVGLLKIGTSWPLPSKLLKKYLSRTDKILFVEEVSPFIENQVKTLVAENSRETGNKTFYGKNDGSLPRAGEMNPDLVIAALGKILGIDYLAFTPEYEEKLTLPADSEPPIRQRGFCPGCPHRATYWSIHRALKKIDHDAFVCGDIGCYAMGRLDCGFKTVKTLHCMGSGAGLASGFGQLDKFGMNQPVLAVCGDSTFFHSVLPAMVNMRHNQSNVTFLVLDNGGTAMTGFQPHPGLSVSAMSKTAPVVDVAEICNGMGINTEICDPFDLEKTEDTLIRFMKSTSKLNVLILRQLCALSPEKRHKKNYIMHIDETLCIGDECGCNRLCTRIFQCPGLIWDKEKRKAKIDEVICVGCGVCASICPQGAIKKEEVV